MRQWKVGTITMGLLLVTVGVVSLLSQSMGISLIETVLKWWPLALIMLGLEVLTFSFLSKGEHATLRFDGFSIFIIISILLITTGAYFVQNVLQGNIAGRLINFNYSSKYETRQMKNISVNSDGSSKFILTNHVGDVSVQRGFSNKIEIEAEIVINNNDEVYAKSIMDSLISINEGNIVKVDSNIGNYLNDKNKIQSISIDYVIRIPENIIVDVNNKFGKVNAEELINNLKVSNSNGDININKISGNVDITSKFGKINADAITGNVDLEGSNGDILLRNIGGYAKIINRFGRIELLNIGKKVDVTNSNGDIYIDFDKTAEEDIKIENKFGRITLKLPESQQGNFKCATRFGRITSSLMLKIVEEHGNTQFASGIIGSSKITLTIDNSNGDINLLTK